MLILSLARYNHKWTRMVQDAISTVLICAWLGGMSTESKPGEVGRLLTLEEIGQTFNGSFTRVHTTQNHLSGL